MYRAASRTQGAGAARRRRLRPRNNTNVIARTALLPTQAGNPDSSPHPSRHVCYALHLPDDSRGRTYVGYTVDPLRRLRQHNGELRGGARATARATPGGHTGGAWRHLFVIVVERADGDFGAHEALSLEWHLKRGRGGGARAKKAPRCNNRGVARRLELLREALCLPKFERFRGRIAVFVDEAHIDSAFAVLVDAAGPPCCVMPLGTLFDDAA